MNEMSPARHPTSLPQEAVDRFAAIVGKGHALVDPDQQLPYLKELRDKYVGRSALVLRPGIGASSHVPVISRRAAWLDSPAACVSGRPFTFSARPSGKYTSVKKHRRTSLRDCDPAMRTSVPGSGRPAESRSSGFSRSAR